MPNVIQGPNYGMPTDYTAEMQRISQQQLLAQLLQRQSMQQPQTQMIGNVAIKTSPMEGIAKVLQAYVGGKIQNEGFDKMQELAQRRQGAMTGDIQTLLQALQGRPASTGQPDPQEMEQSADQGTPAPQPFQIPAQTPLEGLQAALPNLKTPEYAQLAGQSTLQMALQEAQRRRMMASFGLDQPSAPAPQQALGTQAAMGGAPGPTNAAAASIPTIQAAGGMVGQVNGLGGLPRNVGMALMLADPTGKLFAEAQAKAYAEDTKMLNMRAGATAYKPGIGPVFSVPQNGIQNQYGPQGAFAVGVPGYSNAIAQNATAQAAGQAYGKLPYEAPTVYNTSPAPTAWTPSQAIQASSGMPPPTPGQVLQQGYPQLQGAMPGPVPQPMPAPQSQQPGIVRSQAPTDQQARDMALNLADSGQQFAIQGPQPAQRVPGGGIRLQDQGESAAQREAGKGLGELDNQIRSAGLNASRRINQFTRLGNLLEGVDTGKLQPAAYDLAAYAQSIGLPIDARTPNFQAARALANEMALELRNPSGGAGMPGNFSDQDRKYLQSIIANVDKVPGANRLLVDGMIKMSQRDQEIAALARQYKGKHGGMLDDGFFEEVQAYSDSHPLFPTQPMRQGEVRGRIGGVQQGPNLQDLIDEARRRGLAK